MRILTTQNSDLLMFNVHSQIERLSLPQNYNNMYCLEASILMQEFQELTEFKINKKDLIYIAKKVNVLTKANELSFTARKLLQSINY